MKRRQPCDGCGAERKRWQRLCGSCFASLPGDVRSAVIAAHRERRTADWRKAVTAARAILTGTRTPIARIDAQAAYQRTQAMLGERDA